MRAAEVPGYGHRYRRWVLDSLRYVVVQDLATSGDHIPELTDLYVDVGLVSSAADRARDDRLSLAAEDTSERHSISELLSRRSRMVIALIGPPGSGKSTLLAHVARDKAQAMSVRESWGRGPVPILLALREHAESIVADPAISLADVIRAAVGGGPGREPRSWWERQLGRCRCLVLLDGLDEVARVSDRLAVADWIERQITAHPGNHFVVTSRSHDLPGPLTARADVFVVRPFTARQVRLFLERWYLAAERHATGGSGKGAARAVQMRARESAARLTVLLAQHPTLRDLSGNPLLLTMIAAAHRYRGALPAGRADLYGEICHVLLSRRGQAKDLPELLPWSAKQAILAALAYHLMRDHASSLPVGRVLEIVKPRLERFPSSVTGAAFLDEVSRNGLLVEARPGQYSFAHLTFQEYLASLHISASPDLVIGLAGNVSDPWWHETMLLYATTGDASPIVRACLNSGTVPALTLAFDCGEAGTEIDPDLRHRLDLERRRAFAPGCSAEHRRLVAGVMAARLMRQTLLTGAGTRICARPVPADLYWLFLADTGAPRPDGPCDPDSDQPASGIWGREAIAFVRWLNSILATSTGIGVRLPRHDEVQEEAVAGDLDRALPTLVTCAWTDPPLGLWLRPGQPHPHELSGAALRQAVAADAQTSAIVPQILSAAILNVGLGITSDLDDIRALSGALADDLAARASSGGRAVGLMHAHARAIVLTYAHALELAQARVITALGAADPDLIRALDLASARALTDTIASGLPTAMEHARSRAAELADAIDLDLSVLSAFDDFDIAHAVNLAKIHCGELDQVDLLARSAVTDHGPDLVRVLGLPGVGSLDPGSPLPGVLGLSLRWTARGPLADTLLEALAEASQPDSPARPLPGDLYLGFARALSSRAGVRETTQLKAALDDPLTGPLGELAAAESARTDGSPDGNWVAASRRLADACAPIFGNRQPPSPLDAAALRAVALALAGSSAVARADTGDVFRAIAATVTLIERRATGESRTGESIILALA